MKSDRPFVIALVALLAVLVFFSARWAPAMGATTSTAADTAAEVSDLSLRLAVQNNHVLVGEPVRIRVDVTNRSSELTGLDVRTPWDAVQVTVLREGTQILPTTPAAFIHWRFQPQVQLQPGQTYTYTWSDPSVGDGMFYPLSLWGFKQTLPAGHYTLYVSPGYVIGRRNGHWITLGKTLISNKVELTVS